MGGTFDRDFVRETQWIVKTVTIIPRAKEPSAMPMRSPMLMEFRAAPAMNTTLNFFRNKHCRIVRPNKASTQRGHADNCFNKRNQWKMTAQYKETIPLGGVLMISLQGPVLLPLVGSVGG